MLSHLSTNLKAEGGAMFCTKKLVVIVLISLGAVQQSAALAGTNNACLYAKSHQQCATVPLAQDTLDIAAKKFEAPTNTSARIYVIRSYISVRRRISQVTIDDEVVADIAPLTYAVIDVSAGRHRIKASADREADVELQVEPGKLYYVELEVSSLLRVVSAKLLLLDEREGQSRVLASTRVASLIDTQ